MRIYLFLEVDEKLNRLVRANNYCRGLLARARGHAFGVTNAPRRTFTVDFRHSPKHPTTHRHTSTRIADSLHRDATSLSLIHALTRMIPEAPNLKCAYARTLSRRNSRFLIELLHMFGFAVASKVASGTIAWKS